MRILIRTILLLSLVFTTPSLLFSQATATGNITGIVTDATGKPVLVTMGYLPADYLLQFANEAVKRNQEQTKL